MCNKPFIRHNSIQLILIWQTGSGYATCLIDNGLIDWLIDCLWMPGSQGRTQLSTRCATCAVSYNYTSSPELRGEQYWYMGKSPRVVTARVFSSSVDYFTSTLNVRVEGNKTSRQQGRRALGQYFPTITQLPSNYHNKDNEWIQTWGIYHTY